MDYETAKKILNVECNDYKEIRKKYHKQVLLHHPDKMVIKRIFIKYKKPMNSYYIM